MERRFSPLCRAGRPTPRDQPAGRATFVARSSCPKPSEGLRVGAHHRSNTVSPINPDWTPMAATKASFVLAVHGGAGTIPRHGRGASRAASYHEGLRCALAAGREVLASGGDALDAVTRAVVALEDDPLFNAGRGSVFSAAGTQEMDASVMDGRDHRAGAVAGILGPRNPILAARAVMEHSHHVLLIAEGALAFCREQHVAFEELGYFRTEERRQELQ